MRTRRTDPPPAPSRSEGSNRARRATQSPVVTRDRGAREGVFARTARLSVRRRRLVLLLAAGGVVAAAALGSGVVSHLSQGGFDAPSEQAMRAASTLQNRFGEGPPNVVVTVTARSGTVDSPGVAAAGLSLGRRLAAAPHVANVMSYWSLGSLSQLRTADGKEALVLARITGDQNQIVRREPGVAAALGPAPPGVRVQVGGFAPAFHQVNTVVQQDLVRAEIITVPITLLLLLVVFGAGVAAALPLAVGGVAVVGTLFVLRILTMVTDVSVFALNITTALGLGLAIDYSLFIVSRYREELDTGIGVEEAVVRTVASAGRTVAGSALTVTASLAALLVFPLMFLRSFAYAGVAVALLSGVAAVVVLPAVLAVLGPRVNALQVWPRSVRPPEQGLWSRTATAVMRRPWRYLGTGVALLLVLGTPFLGLRLGYLDYRVLPPGDPVRQVNDALQASFGSGQANAVTVVPAAASRPPPPAATLDGYAGRLSELSGVSHVDTATGVYVEGHRLPAPTAYTDQFRRGQEDAWLSVVPAVNALSPGGAQLVSAVRAAPSPVPVVIGGFPAQSVDSLAMISSRLPIALGLIVAVMFVVLFALFRSVVVPLKALVLNVLSLCATFGAMVWIFQEGHFAGLLGVTATGTLTATMPILMFCVAFGLSMDYEVFLVSRIKEAHDAGLPNEVAVARGLQRSGRIITAAALLMSVVLLGLLTSGISFIKLFGLGLTLAVLTDAFVVRGLLVPAFMRLAGEANWWLPGPLRRSWRPSGPHRSAGGRAAGAKSQPAPFPG